MPLKPEVAAQGALGKEMMLKMGMFLPSPRSVVVVLRVVLRPLARGMRGRRRSSSMAARRVGRREVGQAL